MRREYRGRAAIRTRVPLLFLLFFIHTSLFRQAAAQVNNRDKRNKKDKKEKKIDSQ